MWDEMVEHCPCYTRMRPSFLTISRHGYLNLAFSGTVLCQESKDLVIRQRVEVMLQDCHLQLVGHGHGGCVPELKINVQRSVLHCVANRKLIRFAERDVFFQHFDAGRRRTQMTCVNLTAHCANAFLMLPLDLALGLCRRHVPKSR